MELSEASLENVSRNLGELQDGVRTKQAKFLASASLGCTRAKKSRPNGSLHLRKLDTTCAISNQHCHTLATHDLSWAEQKCVSAALSVYKPPEYSRCDRGSRIELWLTYLVTSLATNLASPEQNTVSTQGFPSATFADRETRTNTNLAIPNTQGAGK